MSVATNSENRPFEDGPKRDITKQVMTMQIMTGALLMGIMTFAAVVLLIGGDAKEVNGFGISHIALIMMGTMIVTRLTVPSMVAKQAVARIGHLKPAEGADQAGHQASTDLKMLGVYQTSMIIGHALLEGAAFFLLVSYMIEGNVIALGGAILMAVLIAAAFPTPGRVESWMERQYQMLRDEKAFDSWS